MTSRHRAPATHALVTRFARRHARTAACALALTLGGCGRRSTSSEVAQPITPVMSESEIRDRDIEFFAERARRDPTGAMDLAHLGALYLSRGRASGDPRDAQLAEEAARHSLRNRRVGNGQAEQVLEAALLAQHRFREALEIALRVRDDDPQNPALQAAVGEIRMELGQYDSARVAFAGIKAPFGDPVVAPRQARWAEIEGKPELARRLLEAARANVRRQPQASHELLAWYAMRLGDVELRLGNARDADSLYREGLVENPSDYRLLSALARSTVAQHKWQAAIAYGERAIGITLDPATLGALSDAYAAIGDTTRSAEYARVLDVVVIRQPGAYHRAWSLFLLDHHRHLDVVARKIRDELRTRQDVYAYDLLAWQLHQQGRDREAESAMKLALREGTRDVLLDAHAKAIGAALQARVAARTPRTSGAESAK